ncbi:hypothetical protein BB560_004454 [Smittium megazygosporum]|uniref:MPN domain-containing protein n=1 Tax=Smittium megazygosporum TaxID=133381 RepID=A0A2T9Z955_9FUNG|nr:hypothetical protein BB560_004454 [Smittium megazygosporum]
MTNQVANHAITKVIIHPLVLLSVVDHYNRMAKNTKKRVVGVLLGQVYGNVVNVANSFAVPFEEEFDKLTNSNVWFLDHNYVETMCHMFKKVNVKETLVGWYHSGPKLNESDLLINDVFKKFVPDPVLVVVNVNLQSQNVGLPTNAYFSVEEIQNDGSAAIKTFEHIPSEIGAEEAEEIGVEHLLRDVKDNAVGTLSKRLSQQVDSLRGLSERLEKISEYLQNVVDGNLPVNYEIILNIQKIFNLLPKSFDTYYNPLKNNQPNLPNSESLSQLQNSATMANSSITRATNDSYLILYISSMIRAIISLHDLITNKIENRDSELEIEASSASVEATANATSDSKKPTEAAKE